MIRRLGPLAFVLSLTSVALAQGQTSTTSVNEQPPNTTTPVQETKSVEPSTHADGMKAYHDALAARRLGGTGPQKVDDVRDLTADGEQLLASGRVKAVIDRRYSLDDAAGAFRYLESNRVRGKLIVEC